MRQLRIAGNVGRGVIRHLGACCTMLTSLEVASIDVPLASLDAMHLLLPALNHLSLRPSDRRHSQVEYRVDHQRIDRSEQEYADRVIEHCTACPGLTRLDAY